MSAEGIRWPWRGRSPQPTSAWAAPVVTPLDSRETHQIRTTLPSAVINSSLFLSVSQTLKRIPIMFIESDWMLLNKFSRDSGLGLIMCLNTMQRSNGEWDPRDALDLITFSNEKEFPLSWQLGYGILSLSK